MEEISSLRASNDTFIHTLVWGAIDCQQINCLEILFYIVASLTFLILVNIILFLNSIRSLYLFEILKVIFILLIFILTKNCNKTKKFKPDEEKVIQTIQKNEQVISSKQNEAYMDPVSETVSEEEDSENSEIEQFEDEQRNVKKIYSEKEWEMHKKRTKLFEEQERIKNSQNKMPHNNFGFSYADPDEGKLE